MYFINYLFLKVILIKEREISKDTKSTKTQTRKKPFGGGVAQSNAVVYLRNDLPGNFLI